MAVAGLSGIVVGQVLETADARVDEPGATDLEGLLHTASQTVTNLALLAPSPAACCRSSPSVTV